MNKDGSIASTRVTREEKREASKPARVYVRSFLGGGTDRYSKWLGWM